MPKFRSINQFSTNAQDLETLSVEDKPVVPNMALSVKDILRRFQAGTLPENMNMNYYDSADDDIDNPAPIYTDLTDLSDMSVNIEQVVNKAKSEQSDNSNDV